MRDDEHLTFYRADKRNFEVGESIVSAGEFILQNPDGSQEVENIFEKFRPESCCSRKQVLFVFKNECDAKKHWSKMIGGILYEVKVHRDNVLFEADMALFNSAYVEKKDSDAVCRYAKQYWAGNVSEKPIIEVFLKNSSAEVSRVISKDRQEREKYFKSWAFCSTE